MYQFIVTRNNWREAESQATKMFGPGWLHFPHVSHYFKDGCQWSLCNAVTRNGGTPDFYPSHSVCEKCKSKLHK